MKLATITFANRAIEGENSIRQRFARQAEKQKELFDNDLSPALELSIGEPEGANSSPLYKLAFADLGGKDSLPNGYSPSKGHPQYVRYATQLFNHRNPGLNAKDENILLTNGGTGALAALAASVLEPGKKVLFPVPGFVAQMPALAGYGAQVVKVETHDTGFKLSPERLDQMLQDNPETAFVVFNDITNPTGAKYSEEELQKLGEVFRKEEHQNVLIFLDETYHDLALDRNAKFFLQVNPDLKHRVVIEYSTAKDIVGEPGLRGAMVYAPMVQDAQGKEINLATKMAGQQLNMITAVPTPTQYVVARAIEAKLNIHYNEATKTWEEGGRYHAEHQQWEPNVQQIYTDNRTLASQQFTAHGMETLVKPGGGFFLLIDAKQFHNREIPDTVTSKNGLVITDLHKRVGGSVLDTDIKVANYLMEAAEMITVEASPFGMPASECALRVSVAKSPERLKEISERIAHAKQLLVPQIVQDKLTREELSWVSIAEARTPVMDGANSSNNNRLEAILEEGRRTPTEHARAATPSLAASK